MQPNFDQDQPNFEIPNLYTEKAFLLAKWLAYALEEIQELLRVIWKVEYKWKPSEKFKKRIRNKYAVVSNEM